MHTRYAIFGFVHNCHSYGDYEENVDDDDCH